MIIRQAFILVPALAIWDKRSDFRFQAVSQLAGIHCSDHVDRRPGRKAFASTRHHRVELMENDFDLQAFFLAVETRRRNEDLSWPGLAAEVWALSRDLNELRGDHPISPATLKNLSAGRGLSCQHALFLLRWLGVAPEVFIALPHPDTLDAPLPQADKGHRLRWNLRKLYKMLDVARTKRSATWRQAANVLHGTPSQLTGLRSAKFATSMVLAMRIAQALHLPAAHFVYVAQW